MQNRDRPLAQKAKDGIKQPQKAKGRRKAAAQGSPRKLFPTAPADVTAITPPPCRLSERSNLRQMEKHSAAGHQGRPPSQAKAKKKNGHRGRHRADRRKEPTSGR